MTFEDPSHQNAWAHTTTGQRPHLGPALRSPQSRWIGDAGLLGVHHHPRSAPEGPHSRDLAPQRRGLQTPEPQRRTHPAALTPRRPLRAPLVIQGGSTGRALEPWRHSKVPRAKTLESTCLLASALTSVSPSARRTASGSGLRASWRLKLTIGRPLRGHSKGTWCSNVSYWGPRSPSEDSPCLPVATQAARGAAGHSGGGEPAGPSEPRRPSKAPRAKVLRNTLPLASALTSARAFARRTAGGLGLPASRGLTLTLGLPQRAPAQVARWRKARDWRPPCPSAGLTLLPRCNPGCYGRRRSFGVGKQAGTPSRRRLSKAPGAKTLGPTLPLASALRPTPHPPHSLWTGPASLLGANRNPRSATEGPIPRGLAP